MAIMKLSEIAGVRDEHVASSGLALQAAAYSVDGEPVVVDLTTGEVAPADDGTEFVGDSDAECVIVEAGRWVQMSE